MHRRCKVSPEEEFCFYLRAGTIVRVDFAQRRSPRMESRQPMPNALDRYHDRQTEQPSSKPHRFRFVKPGVGLNYSQIFALNGNANDFGNSTPAKKEIIAHAAQKTAGRSQVNEQIKFSRTNTISKSYDLAQSPQ